MPSPSYSHGVRTFESLRATRAPLERFRAGFQPLPPPTRDAPYFRMELAEVLSEDEMARIASTRRMIFHALGDTGGVKAPVPQRNVAYKMVGQLHVEDPAERPSFCYLLGDVVYYKGEADNYYDQFYDAYEHYAAPIFAIPGNHDGMPNDKDEPLGAFVRNFCAPEAVITADAVDLARTAMIQPNCYFTLRTPVATIIGLYSNVPEGGMIEEDQVDWFCKEMAAAPNDLPIIVTVHHPAYSLDNHHSGSTLIKDIIDRASAFAHLQPHLVLSGHVHNYQRYTRHRDGVAVPYLLAGAGGYYNLHKVVPAVSTPHQLHDSDHVTLESYKDDRHGFTRIIVDGDEIITEYYTVPRPHESWSAPAKLHDRVRYDWKQRAFL